MSRAWYAQLNGVALAGTAEPDAVVPSGVDVVVGELVDPPEGLGVPALRTEDVTYPQRDGTDMFSDWYSPRIVTLEAGIGPGDCDCGAPRRAALALSQAWSRHCGQTELVIWPDCGPAEGEERDPEIHGPFGVVGRPRACEIEWVSGTKEQIADATLRFDSVDHRLYILDEDGTPGSGAVCSTATDTPVAQTVDEFVTTSGMVDAYYPEATNRNEMWSPTVQNDATSLTGFAFSNTLGGSSSGPSLMPGGGVTYQANGVSGIGGGTITFTLTDAITYNAATTPYVTLEYYLAGPLQSGGPQSITARLNSTGTYIAPIATHYVYDPDLGPRFFATWELTASVTSYQFQWTFSFYGAGRTVFANIHGYYTSSTPYAASPQATPVGAQILPNLNPQSYNAATITYGLFRKTVTSGMFGFWYTGGSGRIRSLMWNSNYLIDFFASRITWNGTLNTAAFNSFLASVLDSDDPTLIVVTWSTNSLRIWTNHENGGLYPQPYLAQQFTYTGLPIASSTNTLTMGFDSHQVSDVIAGINHGYETAATVNTFVSDLAEVGAGTGSEFILPDVGTECSPLQVTFTGGVNPTLVASDGTFVEVAADLTGQVAQLDTSTGTLLINGAPNPTALLGDPFLTAAPGDVLNGFGGGDITVCFRPAVISA